MARVSIEQSFFAASALKWLGQEILENQSLFDQSTLWEALGKWLVIKLWQESQSRMLTHVDAKTILIWSGIRPQLGQNHDQHFVIRWLEELAIIKKEKELFYIKGNSERISSIKKHAAKSKKGGLENKKRLQRKNEKATTELKSLENSGEAQVKHRRTTGEPQLKAEPKAQGELSVLVCSGMVSSGIVSSEEELINSLDDHSHDRFSDGVNPPGQEKNPPALLANSPKPEKAKKEKSPGEVSDGSKVWTAYAMAYEQRMRVTPIRNAKQNALCSQLVQRLGVENAVKIAAFYLTHPNSYYMQNKYPLGLLVKDCEGIYTEFQRGEYVTAEKAKRASVAQENHQALERYLASQEN